MKYLPVLYFLLCFYKSPCQPLKDADLSGSWTTNSSRFYEWNFKENYIVDINKLKTSKTAWPPMNFFYELDSVKKDLKVIQTYGEVVDTVFLFKIIQHNPILIKLNYYKKIIYSRTTEKPKKEIIITNKGAVIILQKK